MSLLRIFIFEILAHACSVTLLLSPWPPRSRNLDVRDVDGGMCLTLCASDIRKFGEHPQLRSRVNERIKSSESSELGKRTRHTPRSSRWRVGCNDALVETPCDWRIPPTDNRVFVDDFMVTVVGCRLRK